ncbi:acyl-CoA dehydrogenase [Allohahella marinimesophila]|uniref:Acyl-CoA dehydrogenase n=1 Tax=Allohahella marinimesophila TaxID=1054972 RepID=A0ABP7PSV5_9GAMM
MTDNRLSSLLDNEQLQPLLPVLYIAWADVELNEPECERISELSSALPEMDDESRATLDTWLKPDKPPTATELSALRRHIREQMKQHKPTLVAMCAAMKADCGEKLTAAVAAYEQEHYISGAGVYAEIFSHVEEPVQQDFAEPSPSFQAEDLQAVLEGDYASEWAAVRRILGAESFAYSFGESSESQRKAVLDWLKHLASEKMGLVMMPESVGGKDDMPAFIHMFAALAMFDLSLVVKFGVQFGLFGGSILFLGSERHHKKYLADIASLKRLGGFAMSESGHGSNVRELETTATYDPESGSFVLNSPTISSRKEWIGNAARDGRTMTVFAQLETGGEQYGVHAFVVDIRDDDGALLDGVRVEDCGHKMGLNGVDNGRLYFDQVKVPRDNLLDRYASVSTDGAYDSPIPGENKRFFTMLGTLVGGRISVAAASVVAARKSLAIAVRYGALRRQFGGGDGDMTILDYTTHQLRLFPALAHNFALHFAVEDLIQQFRHRTPDTSRDIETLAAGIKAMASWHAISATQAARECCGGQGFLSENQISIIRRDVDVFATFEGDNTVLMQLLAKNNLANYAKGFEQDLVLTFVRELTRKAKTELLEGNPLIARKTDDDHLRDADFHRDILSLRAHNLLVSAARRIRKRIDNDVDPFLAFNQIQDHLMSYATAEMERHIAEQFFTIVDAMSEGPARDALEKMRQLSAIDAIYSDSAWFLDNGYFQPEKHRALRKVRIRLLAEIRPDALAYVESFAIPDGCLSAPIAFEDYIGKSPLKQVDATES